MALARRRGRDVFFEALRQEGVDYLFGNPGTTELPIMDGLPFQTDVRYILCLHEDVAVGAAMGYAASTGKVGVVNLHVAPGLAHGLGNLYNAWRSHIPLVVTAGQHDTPFQFEEPILWGDMVAMARPLTKWSYEVRTADELGPALQRAFKVAATPPQGPVFLSLPRDVLLAETERPLPPPAPRYFAPVAQGEALRRMARLIAEAERPLLVVGDAVSRSGGWDEAVALAEAAGMPVRNEPLPHLFNFPSDHPLFLGPTPVNRRGIEAALDGVDLVLLVGVANQAPGAMYDGRPTWLEGRRIIYLGDAPWELAKNAPGLMAVLGDPRGSMAALREVIAATWSPEEKERAARRAEATARETGARRLVDREAAAAAKRAEGDGLPVRELLLAIQPALPRDTVVVNEGVSNGFLVQRYLEHPVPGSYMGSRGGSLGYGASMSLGAQLGRPDRPTLCISGDGALLYYPQVIWTAAHHRIPVTFLVLNNSSYRILKLNFQAMGGDAPARGQYPHTDITDPAVDFSALARAFGVSYRRIERLEEARETVAGALAEEGPVLVEALVERGV